MTTTMRRLLLAATVLGVAACGPTTERWDGKLDRCDGNSDLEDRRVLLYLELSPGDTDAEGWIGVAESPNADETFLFTDLERGSFDGVDLEFEADFGNINATVDLKRDGPTLSGDVDIDYPIFGGERCDMELDLT